MNKLTKILLIPVLVSVVSAVLVQIFTGKNVEKGSLVLENITLYDAEESLMDSIGSWYINSANMTDYLKIKKAAASYARQQEKIEDSEDYTEVHKETRELEKKWDALTGYSAIDYTAIFDDGINVKGDCNDFSDSPLVKGNNAFHGLDSYMFFNFSPKENNLGKVGYSLGWRFDERWSFTRREALEQYDLQGVDDSGDCFLYVMNLYDYFSDGGSEEVSPDVPVGTSSPVLDLLIRNVGEMPTTLISYKVKIIESIGYGAGGHGTQIMPVGGITNVDLSNQRTKIVAPISINPQVTSRLMLSLDSSNIYLGDGGGLIVFDLWVEYFNGEEIKTLFVGRFHIENIAGYWFG
ncbi:TPA: hypothetical protein I7738_21065 [Vibrio vulnificus]|nr:hypothetical protein [Vibrio vulnificus]